MRTREQERSAPRPVPDEAAPEDAPTPQPERREPRLHDPGVGDLSRRDWVAVFIRAAKELLDDNMTMIASALAYSTFFAIPSVLLVVVGVFTLVADPSTIDSLIQRFGDFMPAQATQLLHDSLTQLSQKPSTGLTMTVVGFVLAIWSTTGAMTAYMTALNMAYDRKDSRRFVKRRLTALAMVACMGFAFVLVGVLVLFGPAIERAVGDALGIQGVLKYVWWVAQWPILIGGLLAAFATLLWLGPDVDRPRWRFITPGSIVAVVLWVIVSAAFAVYTSKFGSYNKTWGSLSAVIVMLTWLWLTGLALLFGAEVNAEVERSRELREGKPAARDVQAPADG